MRFLFNSKRLSSGVLTDKIAVMMMRVSVGIIVSSLIASAAIAQQSTTQPTTRPSAATMPADQLLQQMLRPAGGPAAKPLTPVENLPTFNQTTGAVAMP